MKNLTIFFIWTLTFVLVSYNGFCGPSKADERERRVAMSGPRHGGELRMSVNHWPNHLNPAVQSGIVTGIPGSQLFARLLLVDREWNFAPYLAHKWETSPDGLSMTFYLRRGATFHNGAPITSEDVAFSIMTVKKEHPFSTMLAPVERVDTPDKLTAVVRLRHPYPALELVAASPMLPILPKAIYGDGQDLKSHPANWKVVGSGPFKLDRVKERHSIVMSRYDGFFMPDRPYLDKIIIKQTKPDAMRLSLEIGTTQLNGFQGDVKTNSHLAKMQHLKIDFDSYSAIGPLIWLAFNLKKKPFDDLRVRQAFAYTIDRPFLAEHQFGGRSMVATGPISPGTPLYTDNVQRYDKDLKKANQLLDQAGYKRDEKGKRFSTTLHYISWTAVDSKTIAQYLRSEMIRQLGVDLELVRKPIREWARDVSNGEFSLALDLVFNWGDPVIGVHRTYDSRNIRKGVIWSNTQGYANPEIDKLMDSGGKELDLKKRKKIYAEFQKILARELPVYWLSVLPYATIYHRDLNGVTDSIWGIMTPFDQVYWSEGSIGE